MGGFFGVVAQQGCVPDVYFGTDYHSHMGTVRGGMAFFAGNTFHRSIHNIQNTQFRACFERAAKRFAGLNPNYGIGVISDHVPLLAACVPSMVSLPTSRLPI